MCFQNLSENINNKCTEKTKLKHSTTYCNGSNQRFSFTGIQNMDKKVNINTLSNIATEYLRNINKPKSNDQNNTKNTKNIKVPLVTILGPKLRQELKRKDIKTLFMSGANLKSSCVKISRKLYLFITRASMH